MSSSLSTRPKLTSKLPVVADVNAACHTLTIAQTLARLDTDDRIGLTDRQIIDRQQEFGANELVAAASRHWWQILLDQFTNIMLVMSMVVAVVSGIFDFMEIQSGKTSGLPFKDTIAILSIVILKWDFGLFPRKSRRTSFSRTQTDGGTEGEGITRQ